MEDTERAAYYEALIRRLYYAVIELDPYNETVRMPFTHGRLISEQTHTLEAFFSNLREHALTDSGRLLEMTAKDLAAICEKKQKRDFCMTIRERPNITNRFVLSFYGMPEEKKVYCTVAIASEADDVITILIKRSPVTFKSDQIMFVDYDNHSVEIHCKDRIRRFFSVSFSDVADMLLMHRNFVRSYKNCIVNMDKVDRIENDAFIMQMGEVISIPKRRLKEICATYEEYLAVKMAMR